MPRIVALALLLMPLLAVGAPVPKRKAAFGPFGDLTDSNTKCLCKLSKTGVLRVTVPIDHPAEPNEAGAIRLLAERSIERDFVLTIRVSVTPAAPGSSRLPEHIWAAGVGLAAHGDPQLGAAILVGQETQGGDVNTVAIFRYSRHVQPPLQGLQGASGVRTPMKPGEAMWLRLTRRGEVVTGEWSADGKEWATTSEERLPDLPDAVMVGPIVARLAEAQFTATLDEYELVPLPKRTKK